MKTPIKLMSRRIFSSVTMFLTLLVFLSSFNTNTFSQAFVDQNGQLSIKGTSVVNKNGEAIQLKGMSLFWSQWGGKYYTYNALKWLRDDWKCNAVRAAMGIEGGGYLSNPDVERKRIYSIIDAAIELNMYVIVDWHDHHGQWHTKQSKIFFAELAQKYGNKANLLYEIYNEPLQISWTDSVKPYNVAVIDTIRAHDPDNIIICGTTTWSQDVDIAAADPINRSNIAYTLHYYAATHKQALRDKAQVALNKGVALFVTEYGTCEASGDGVLEYSESKQWWDLLDKYNISHFNWSLNDKTETASALILNASVDGNWDASAITKSGKYVRAKLRNESLEPFFK